MSKYQLFQFNSETDEYELDEIYETYRGAANARDLSISCNSGRLRLHDFQIRALGVDKVYAYEVRVFDSAEPEREVVIDAWETLEVAEWEMQFEIKVGQFPAENYRIVAVEEVS